MSSNGIKFDDFDLDLNSDSSLDGAGSSKSVSFVECLVTDGGGFNSSTSMCCALATNATESCSWCNGCP